MLYSSYAFCIFGIARERIELSEVSLPPRAAPRVNDSLPPPNVSLVITGVHHEACSIIPRLGKGEETATPKKVELTSVLPSRPGIEVAAKSLDASYTPE